jgi:hypothetical protein
LTARAASLAEAATDKASRKLIGAHVHVIVPSGGLSPDGARWIACKPGFFLPVRVLSRLFRRHFLEGFAALHKAAR